MLKESGDSKYLPVYVAASGVTAYVSSTTTPTPDCQGCGKAVLVNHTLPSNQALPDGTTRVTSIYGHFQVSDSMPIIKLGTQVKKGETVIGYLADQDHCGGICQGAHVRFGIRTNNSGEPGFPNCRWGYVPQTNSEFSNWLNPIDFIKSHQVTAGTQARRNEIKSDNFLPGWNTFYVCDSRRIKAYFDDKQVFYSSSDDGDQPSLSAKVFAWPPGKHVAEAEFFDTPDSSPVDLSWALFPSRPACASEPVVIVPTQIPTLPSARLVPTTLTIAAQTNPTATSLQVSPSAPSAISAPTASANNFEIVKRALIRSQTSATSQRLSNEFFTLFEVHSKRKDVSIGAAPNKISLIGSSGIILNSGNKSHTAFRADSVSIVIPREHFNHNPLSSGGSRVEDTRLYKCKSLLSTFKIVPKNIYDIGLAGHQTEGGTYPRHTISVLIENKSDFVFSNVNSNGAVFVTSGNLVDILSSPDSDSDTVAYGQTISSRAISLSLTGRCVGQADPSGYILDYEVKFSKRDNSVFRYFTTRVR